MDTHVRTLPHYADSHIGSYVYCFCTFENLPSAAAEFLLHRVHYNPTTSYTTLDISQLYADLSADLFHSLKHTNYVLAQRPQSKVELATSSIINPVLGLSFIPGPPSVRECELHQRQLEILDPWRTKFDALFWLQHAVNAKSGVVVYAQLQQQQRDLKLLAVLHDVNRWLIEWDEGGRCDPRSPMPMKVSRPRSKTDGEEEADFEDDLRGRGEGEPGVVRRGLKRMKLTHGRVSPSRVQM